MRGCDEARLGDSEEWVGKVISPEGGIRGKVCQGGSKLDDTKLEAPGSEDWTWLEAIRRYGDLSLSFQKSQAKDFRKHENVELNG